MTISTISASPKGNPPMNLPTIKSKAKPGQVSKVRDKLTFTDEWSYTDSLRNNFCLRLYRTNGGIYGQQFQAVLWIYGPSMPDLGPWIGSRTNGCGYNKQDAAINEVLALAGYSHREGSDHQGIADAIGCDPYAIHHAHG
jgi:hypothetical protein